MKDLVGNAEIMFPHILDHSHLPQCAGNMFCALVKPMYAHEVQDLVDCGDLHFSVQKMNSEDIEDFKLEELSDLYAKQAPRLWSLWILFSRHANKGLLCHFNQVPLLLVAQVTQ